MTADPTPEPRAGEPSTARGWGHVSDDPEVVELWRRFKEHGDPSARERLILQYSPLVKYVAGRVSVGLPPSVEYADLTSYGLLGLIDAIEKFDVDKGVKFETYAVPRIKGAIIDELRALDWVPRSVRSKVRNVEQAVGELENRLHRTPSEEELAEEMDLDVDQLRRTLAQTSLVSIVALDEPLSGGDDDDGQTTRVDTIKDEEAVDPQSRLEDVEVRELLSDELETMSERERTLVRLYYFEGMTLAQIGEVLGVTESRVCQIHAKAVLSLRSRMLERLAV